MTAPQRSQNEHRPDEHRPDGPAGGPRAGRVPVAIWVVLALAVAGIVIYLLVDHRPHVLAAVPYAAIVAVLAFHLFGHGGHGGHGGAAGGGGAGGGHGGHGRGPS